MTAAFERVIAAGGVVLFPADTVYGLACDPENAEAVARLYGLKGRSPDKPAAVMFFDLDRALAELPDVGPRTMRALRALLPGALTVVLADPGRRFTLASPGDPTSLGIRVPALPPRLEALAAVGGPVLQSSANRSGGPDARRLADVPQGIRAGADLVLDGGDLPGTPSTVVDLRRYEEEGAWEVLREGAVSLAKVAGALQGA